MASSMEEQTPDKSQVAGSSCTDKWSGSNTHLRLQKALQNGPM
eukprot:CAMPEP_0172737782 /NCGR_PEP_ID=MMETSP1074-20121228/118585_1 /TAXON_ID=2916 /ORGANISM="Ceratium fusus, Strain PA161109" /LENGTH=42 /DNA_ID= /DNA_START= /DNA_END= /DNA_ORIENTATION=